MRDVPANTRVAGQPAVPIKDAMRSFSLIERLPEWYRQIKQLEDELAKLRKKPDEQ
jgi:UDP-3-O-[3-hydroxymyristoyl] glucosamine N-acyltransferase